MPKFLIEPDDAARSWYGGDRCDTSPHDLLPVLSYLISKGADPDDIPRFLEAVEPPNGWFKEGPNREGPFYGEAKEEIQDKLDGVGEDYD